MQDLFLTHSIELQASPAKIHGSFLDIVDDESYRAWHPDDHVSMR
jgi:hypothetical protein